VIPAGLLAGRTSSGLDSRHPRGDNPRVPAPLCSGACLVAALIALAAIGGAQSRPVASVEPLELVRTIPLEKVEGRIDHLAVDLAKKRLFVAALGANSVEVVDLAAGKRVHRIEKMSQAQGVRFLPAPPRLVATTGGDGRCRFFDDSLKEIGAVDSLPDADNVRFDAAANRVWVGCGSGDLVVIDPVKMVKVATIGLAGHPESFQLETAGKRIFANVPDARHVAVVDREKGKVVATWPLGDLTANFPMALDEPNHRLFVVCRKPAKVLVIDTESGRTLQSLDAPDDADDAFYDAARARLYVSGGVGMICVYERKPDGTWFIRASVPTAPRARTCLFEPETSRLWVAVPHAGAQKAELREFQVKP
jgi:hypothetical protein